MKKRKSQTFDKKLSVGWIESELAREKIVSTSLLTVSPRPVLFFTRAHLIVSGTFLFLL